MTNLSEHITPRLARLQRPALAVGVAGLALWAAGALFDLHQALNSYLWAYIIVLGYALGCTAILLVHHTVTGRWTFCVQRIAEAGARTLPLVTLMFLPVVLGMGTIYPWLAPEAAHNEVIQLKSFYLNVPFFLGRAIAFFAIWNLIAWGITRWPLRRETDPSPRLDRRIGKLAAGCLPVYVLTLTFAVTDWTMSLEPEWHSTMYGAIFVVGQGLTAIAFTIVIAALVHDHPALARWMTPDRFHDLGKMLLTFIVFWAYVNFSQYLIIWSGNLPEEISWYLNRTGEGLVAVSVVIVLFHFLMPMFLLFSRRLKRTVAALTTLAAFVLVMRLVDLYWQIQPSFHPQRLTLHWLDVAALAGLGGLWFAAYISRLAKRPLMARGDPRTDEAFGPIAVQEVPEHA